ncbi:MAG TPA: ABC transporter ATP-binding protein [Candidatus Acidoferrum sp.]|nr:ABC transporter ATP-binding protein [Candidatus Acidoferrum sp.]
MPGLCTFQRSHSLFSNEIHAINSGVSDSAITVDSLEKSFPRAYSGWRALLQPFAAPSSTALRGVSLQVSPGEAVALLGTNGAGKTTLLRILATLLIPTRGTAIVAGFDCARDPKAVRRNLGYHAGSDLGFYARLTGAENLRFFGRLNYLSDSFLRTRIPSLAERFELGGALDRQVRTLSSGTIQRLSLVRALLHQPKVLLLDEPTRSLDALAAADFRRFLKAEVLQRQGTSLLFASHTLPEIETLADRVAILKEGNLITVDTPAALKSKAGTDSLEEAFSRLTGHSARSLEEFAC